MNSKHTGAMPGIVRWAWGFGGVALALVALAFASIPGHFGDAAVVLFVASFAMALIGLVVGVVGLARGRRGAGLAALFSAVIGGSEVLFTVWLIHAVSHLE